jgi:hypothetical protein
VVGITENEQNTIVWQGNQQFYGHLGKVWDTAFNSQIVAFDSVIDNREGVLMGLQRWYLSLKQLFYMVTYVLTEAEVTEVELIISTIDEETKHTDFYQAVLNDNVNINIIYDQLELLSKKTWYLLGKYNFLPKKQKNIIYDSVDEQIEVENS